MIFGHKDQLGYLVEDLVYKQQIAVAFSIVVRHNLLEGNHIEK